MSSSSLSASCVSLMWVLVLVVAPFLTAADTPSPHPSACAFTPVNASCPTSCSYNIALHLCYDPTCPQLVTAATCQAVTGCAWANNRCRDYNLQYGAFANCSLAASADVCGGNCEWSTRLGTCIVKPNACAWGAQTNAGCADECTWGAAIQQCYDPTCANLATSATCAGKSGCAWYNGYCYDYNLQYSRYACSLASQPSECPSSRCHWNLATQTCLSGPPTLQPTPRPTASPVAAP